MERLVEELERGFKDRLWERGAAIVVAVSGGPDSMALLHALHAAAGRWELRLGAAHANHGFRPEESRSEHEGVRAFAERLGIPFYSAELDVPAYLERRGGNKQDAARKLRYKFLHEAAAAHGASAIALAHHADDQAETVLMRIIRGTAPSGLAGIAPRRTEGGVELIRPLLRIGKSDLLDYCSRFGVPSFTDSSNEHPDYFRNAVRLEAIPSLERFNSRLRPSLCRLAEAASAEADFLDRETESLHRSLVASTAGGMTMRGADLAGLHVALQRRLIKLILDYLALEKEPTGFEEVENIRLGALAAEPSNWRIDLSRGLRFRREYGQLSWERRPAVKAALEEREAPLDGRLVLEEAGLLFAFRTLEDLDGDAVGKAAQAGPHRAVFDLDKLSLPLAVRPRRAGDRMSAMGLNGTKKVQDMFVDAKVPPSRRDLLPLLCDGEGTILWIPGIRRSAEAAAEPESRRLLVVESAPNPARGLGSEENGE
ncbi:tRNA lysidine(34) synthetase TilS [Paenibacillus sp. D51F]